MNRRSSWSRLAQTLGVLWAAIALCGCPTTQPPPGGAARPFEGQSLRLLVVDDPALATAARRFAAEWKAQTGASYDVAEASALDFGQGKAPAADALIYPASYLPGLAQRGALKTVPRDVLADGRLAWLEVFETLRLREARWGSKTFGLPLGSPVLTCYYRADLFEKLDRKPPKTWSEYQQLVEFFGNRENLGEATPPADAPWSGTIEPLADGWAGLTLLARAASYAKHPDFYSALFNMESMEPLIDTPPLVKALEELATAAGDAASRPPRLDPAGIRAAFWRGECAMALSWPTAAKTEAAESGKAGSSFQVGFCQLPGAREVYNPGERRWEMRATPISTPLVSLVGRIASVASESQHAPAAFQLLIALSGQQWGHEVGPASPATTLFRSEHLKSARTWVEPRIDPAAARRYAELTSETLAGQDCLPALCLPGREEYLAALDAAVVKTLAKESSAADALKECAAQWRVITEELGRQQQLDVYRGSVVNTP